MNTAMAPLTAEVDQPNSRQQITVNSPWEWCVLGGIVLLGLILRCHGLVNVHTWFDESFSWRMAQFPLGEIITRSEQDYHPPLHPLILALWGRLFGMSLASLRFSSAFFGTGTILGGYFLAKAACDSMKLSQQTMAGLVAALFIALSPFQIHWSQQARTYALGSFLTVWSTWFLLRWCQQGHLIRLVCYVPLAAMLALQHHFGTFTVFAQLTFALVWCGRRVLSGIGKNDFVALLLAGWAVLSLWALWLIPFLMQRAQFKESFWTREFQWNSAINVWKEFFLADRAAFKSETFSWLLAELVLASVLLLLVHRQSGARLMGWLVLVPFSIAILWSLLDRNLFVSRFLIHAHVCLLIGIAILLASIPLRPVRMGLMMLITVGMAITAYQQHLQRTRLMDFPGMPAVVSALRDLKSEKELVLVCNPMLYLNVCVYNDSLTNVFSFDPGHGFPPYQGPPAMKAEEYLGLEGLDQSGQDWVWTLDAENWLGGTWKVHLPTEWQLQEEQKIREWYATLVLRSYRREVPAQRPSSAVVTGR